MNGIYVVEDCCGDASQASFAEGALARRRRTVLRVAVECGDVSSGHDHTLPPSEMKSL